MNAFWLIVMVVWSMSVWVSPGWAGSKHLPDEPAEAEEGEHTPRHGGSFGDADDIYHYEALINPERQLVVYVGDWQNRPMDARQLTGQFTVNPDDPQQRPVPLVASADGEYLWAPLSAFAGPVVPVKVEVRKEEQWVGMEFYLPRATD